MPSHLGTLILDKVRDHVKQRVIQAINENMAHGPSALNAVDQNIRDLYVDVQKYHARFTSATEAMMRERKTNFDYLVNCQRINATSELGIVQQIIEEVRRLSDVSSDLEARAMNRVLNMQQQLRQTLDQERQSLERFERNNYPTDKQALIARQIRYINTHLVQYHQRELELRARGNSLQQICAEMIALLTTMKITLRDNQSSYVYFANDCREWQRAYDPEGVL